MEDNRILCEKLRARVMSAAEAARLVEPGMTVGVSGFTTGCPKAVPFALAERTELHDLTLLCGAAFGPHIFGPLIASGIFTRFAGFEFDVSIQEAANSGALSYIDCHLGLMERKIRRGEFGRVGVSIIECAQINADGSIVPSVSVGIVNALLECSDKVILEVNRHVPAGLAGFHDIAGQDAPPVRSVLERVGEPVFRCDPERIAAVVEKDEPELEWDFRDTNEVYDAIAANVTACLDAEIARGGLGRDFTLQIGAGGVANAVLEGLRRGGYRGLKMFTEVFTPAALGFLDDGLLSEVSTTCFDMDEKVFQHVYANLDFYRQHVVLRPIEQTNRAQNILNMELVAMNTAVEADIYGNVNSTNVLGSRMIYGIGGANDFAKNARLTFFFTPSTAKDGRISAIVPMVSHVDNTEHDVDVLITEYGCADLRGKSPKERAALVIENCAHPDFRPALRDYCAAALASAGPAQTPHDLRSALSWHERCRETGTMRA